MTRVATLASHNLLVARMMQTQQNVQTKQYQVTTGKISQDYKGLSNVANTLVNIENEAKLTKGYLRNNQMLETNIEVKSDALNLIEETVKNFRTGLQNFTKAMDNLTEKDVRDVRQFAMNSLRSMAGALNTNVGGKFLFGGGGSVPPVNMDKFRNLADFEAVYSVEGDPNSSDAVPRPFPESVGEHRLDADYYYQGGQLVDFQRLDQYRDITYGMKADDPVFEKAFRAMAMIAQDWGDPANHEETAQHLVTEAMALVKSAIEHQNSFFEHRDDFQVPHWQARAAEQTFGLSELEVAGLTSANAPLRFTSVPNEDDTATVFTVEVDGQTGSVVVPHGDGEQERTVTIGDVTVTFRAAGFDDPDGIRHDDAQFTPVATTVTDAETALDISNLSVSGLFSLADLELSSTDLGGGETRVTAQLAGHPAVSVDINADGSFTLNPAPGVRVTFDAIAADLNTAAAGDPSSTITASAATTPTLRVADMRERGDDYKDAQFTLGMNWVAVNQAIERQEAYAAFLDNRAQNLENVDPLQAITDLLAATRSQEASYSTLARIRQLSLLNYLP